MTGRFITLEGGEGTGKSTQVRALAAELRARGIDVVETREPGGSDGAEAIRTLLLTGSADRWSARAEALLFAGARADHVERTIRPALDAGAWVISDRFLDSSRAYQSGGSGLADADILTLHRIGSGDLMPDRTLVLEAPEAVVIERLSRRDPEGGDRIGGRDMDFHRAVAASFQFYAAQEPDRMRIVDASGPVGEVTHRLLHHLGDLLS